MEQDTSAAKLNPRTRQWLLAQLQLIEEHYGNPLPKSAAQVEALVSSKSSCQDEYVHLAQCLLAKTLEMAQKDRHKKSAEKEVFGLRMNQPLEDSAATRSPSPSPSRACRKRLQSNPSSPLFIEEDTLRQPGTQSCEGNSERLTVQSQGAQPPDQQNFPHRVEDPLNTHEGRPGKIPRRSGSLEQMAPLPKEEALAITTRHNGSTDELEVAPEEPAAQSSNHGMTVDRHSLYEAVFTFLVPRGNRIDKMIIALGGK